MTTPSFPTDRAVLRVSIRALIVLAVALALLAVEFTSRSGVGWRLITFTYQANILAAAYYACTLFFRRADARTGLRGAVVLYVVVAGVVWNLLLTGRSMGYTPANFLLHVVVPILAVADWLLFARAANSAKWWQPFAWLAYPAAYLGLALVVLNRTGRRAPYYFLDPNSVGLAAVAVNVTVLAAGFLGLGYLLLAVARPRSANA
ncbi:Pr6Pr family membrane protein [Mycolicibacterium sp.]|uniref:Pr6Pr family membrane protein n=1 Tax=Mycolicibacterium sp. TaxID=2320850 RepID=UPI001A28C068|nr:Pr6Pr family membrane protein [Mycolicibacterium sp.]MBJ7339177.1 Pr6Pr family membrane protein [Mycolicibacterium sp.]